jgi:serine protease Do
MRRSFGSLLIVSLCVSALAQAQQPATPSKPKSPPASTQAASAPPIIAKPAEQPPPDQVLQQMNTALQNLVERISPAVVQILVTGYGPLNQGERGQAALIVRQHAVGSGVIVDSNGYIMTNAHVVEGAQRVRVALPMGENVSINSAPIGKRQILDARVLGTHKESDLALLKVEGSNFPTLALGGRPTPRVGQFVFAIGSPEGLQNSVTMGVISALFRQADPSKPLAYIQTDAPINPGNSGGPLVDMNGACIGINTFILSQSGGNEGLGFAIPAPVVNFVYRSLRRYGHVHRVEIGATAQEITPALATGLHLSQSWGVIVSDIVPGGPAASAGVKVQDIVLSADGRPIETLPALAAAMYMHRLDEVFRLEVLRGEEKKTLFVAAIERHDRMDQLLDAANPEKSLVPRLGVLAIDLSDGLRAQLGNLRIASGALVVGRAADLILPETGLQTGDLIHSVNDTTIDSVDTLRSAVLTLKSGDAVVLQVERDGGLMYLAFEME